MALEADAIRASLSAAVLPDRPDNGVLARLFRCETQVYYNLTWLFAGLSILARLVRYAMNPPLWGDECHQAAAFLDLGYRDLLGTLPYEQVAPFGFLWIELTVVKVLGFHEWALRLFPLLTGIGSVLLFRHVSCRLLRGLPCLLAVAVFSSTYSLIRYSCEVKPYGIDVFVAIGLIALMVEWLRAPERVGWLWALALATPLALCVSFPVVFIAGGISVGLLGPVWRARNPWAWASYVICNALLAGAFFALHHWLLSRQYDDSTSIMLPFWKDGFMPIAEPWRIPWWLVQVHTGEMFMYPFGGDDCQSVLTTIGCIAGLACCWERSRRHLLWGALGMFGLALSAAALQRYPYGTHPRVVLYAAGPICLLFGAGAGLFLEKISAQRRRWRVLGILLGTLAILLGAYMVRDVVRPYKAVSDKLHRGLAHWLWTSEPDADLVCVRTDWKLELYHNNIDSAYVCNSGMFHKAQSHGPDHYSPTAGKVLRCVVYHSTLARVDQAALDAWMRQMNASYELVGLEHYPIWFAPDGLMGTYDVYRFLPHAQSTYRTSGKHFFTN
jgi:hypothetical protein